MTKPNNKDPQQDILSGHGAFGVEYTPKNKREKIIDGKVYGGKVFELAPGKVKTLALDRFTIALFRIVDDFYAIKDACPHADYPLSKGIFPSKYVVMCSSHNWQFDVRDGHCVKIGRCGGHSVDDLKVRTFPVEIKEGNLWITVEGTSSSPVETV